MEDAIGQTICEGDCVVILSSPSSPSHHGNRCGLVLGGGGPLHKVLVRCLDGNEVTLNASDVRVADRSFFIPCMTVASSTDRAGQLGNVTATATELDLVRLFPAGDGDENAAAAPFARGVSPAEVRPVGEFRLGDYVVSGAWLGRVVEVCLDVDVVFDDGAACRISRRHDELWEVVNKDGSSVRRPIVGLQDDYFYPCHGFYPGQRVGGPADVFTASRWLEGGGWKPKHGEGTVSKVEATSVLVDWIASPSSSASAPASRQSPRDLTFFSSGNSFELKCWRVGDRCFLHGDGVDADVDDNNGDDDSSQLTASRRRPLLAVASTRTTVDVKWHDGTRQYGLPSASLVLVAQREAEKELAPGEGVVMRTVADCSAGATMEEERVGVVRSYNYKDQTVDVSWFQSQDDSTMVDETLSSYDLSRFRFDDDADNGACYGDIVVRQHKQSYQIRDLLWRNWHSLCRYFRPTTRAAMISAASSFTSAHDLSWVGHYLEESDDGEGIQVRWGDGNTSKVQFHEVAAVKEKNLGLFLQELGEWEDEDGDMDNTIDMVQEDVVVVDNNTNNSEDEDNSGSESDDSSGSESESDSKDDDDSSMRRLMMDLIGVIIQALIRLASKVFAQGRRSLKVGFTDGKASAEASINGGGSAGDGSNMEEKTEADVTAGDDKSFCFPQFEIVQSPSDHHYLDNTNQYNLSKLQQGTVGGRKWTKRVQKEWKILEDNNLPETIYVRAFEDRMDLLRAAMVGASGTPYHDGLFFFDLQLPPSSYPAEPPLVHYRSFGLHVNPNLYPSGTVCLSLLNTFGGRDESELWSPEGSSILQVVVSIQGLVLTAQPYYNEPAWSPAGTPMGQRNELPYSENTFLLNLQTMLHLLRRPPAGFEEFVRDHFRRRRRHVILACEAYQDGCLVGTLDEEGRPTEGSRERPCSAGFRIALGNVLPQLVEAFSSI